MVAGACGGFGGADACAGTVAYDLGGGGVGVGYGTGVGVGLVGVVGVDHACIAGHTFGHGGHACGVVVACVGVVVACVVVGPAGGAAGCS